MKSRKSRLLVPFLATACAWCVPPLLNATTTTYTWDGSSADGKWFTGANWSTNASPGATQAATNYDLAVFDAISGTIDYTPVSAASFDRVVVNSTLTGELTLNINGNLTTTHVENTGNDTFNSGTGTGQSIAVNINSGTYTIQNAGISVTKGNSGTTSTATMTIAEGASVLAYADSTAAYSTYAIYVGGGAKLIVQGSLATRSLAAESSLMGNNNTLRLSGTMEVDGGTVVVDGISSHTNTGDGHLASLVLKNGADVTLRHGGNGLSFRANRNTTAAYTNSISVESGSSMTNYGTLTLGHNADGTRPAYGGTTTMTISGADSTWFQGGTSYIGHGTAVGILNVNAGSFTARSDVYVGGGAATSTAARDLSVDVGGILNINGGEVVVSNTQAGVVKTTTSAGTVGASSARQYWFGQGEGNWDGTYTGQRLQFTSLTGSGALGTGTTYYTVDFSSNPSGQDAESVFAVSDRLGGLSTNLVGTGGYSAASYLTLGSQLIVGSTMTFASGVTRDVAGTLNLSAGKLTVDELVANLGSGKSTLNFTGGELVVGNTYKNATVSGGLAATGATINTGSAFTVGDGIGAAGTATYRMNGGTHTIAHGLALASDGRLTGFGTTTAAISGAGTIDPGNARGIVTAASVAGGAGLGFNFEFAQASAAPVYANAESSGNDVLRLTAATPFAAALTSGNAINAYLAVSALTAGDFFKGGFYADAGDFTAGIQNATFSYYIFGDGQGTHLYNGASYYSLAEYNSIVGSVFSLERSLVQETAAFGGTPVDGYVMQFTVAGAIPEPRALALWAGLAVLLSGLYFRRTARKAA